MKKLFVGLLMICLMFGLTGCDDSANAEDRKAQLETSNKLVKNQPTPKDIEYSLERYNLIKRAYWVNGMRDKANSLASPIADMPLGYIVLITESGDIMGQFTVDGKVSSLNSFLTPDSEYYGEGEGYNDWLADVDGSYGEMITVYSSSLLMVNTSNGQVHIYTAIFHLM